MLTLSAKIDTSVLRLAGSPDRWAALRGRGERKRPTSGWASLITHPDRARRRPTRQRRTHQQRHRHKAFRLTTDRAVPPHPRLHQTRTDLARRTRSSSTPPLTGHGRTATHSARTRVDTRGEES